MHRWVINHFLPAALLPAAFFGQVYLSAEKVLLSTAEWTPPVSWCSVENVPTTGRIKADTVGLGH